MKEDITREEAKTRNIIGMALGFTAMMRILDERSNAKIEVEAQKHFERLNKVNSQDEYDVMHRSFCRWFISNIQTAEKKLRNGRLQQSRAASYGQAAKVLDIAAKVYVYYCGLPTTEVAQRIVPFLHGAVDTPILKELKKRLKSERPGATIPAKTIREVDEGAYGVLQSLVLKESRRRKILRVQYDDIMWRKLNRENRL